MSPSVTTFLFEAANFLLLAALLGWLFFRPVRDALERRRAALAAEREAAERLRAEAEKARAAADERRAALEAEAEQARGRARDEAQAEAKQILEAARTQAEREREQLDRELAARRQANAKTLAGDAAAAAAAVVARLLERVDGPELEAALVRRACSEIRRLGDVGRLAPVVVETARPLAPEARALLAETLGAREDAFEVRVVPELAAGVRLVTHAGIVDASAAGLASRAEEQIVQRIESEATLDE